MRKKCKTHTVFTLKDDKKSNSFWSMRWFYCEKAKKYLQDKYGDNLKEIINERFV